MQRRKLNQWDLDTRQGNHLDEALFFKSWGLSLSRMAVLRGFLGLISANVHVSAADQWCDWLWNQQCAIVFKNFISDVKLI